MRHRAVKSGEQFLEADGVERVEITQRDDSAGLVDHAALHHLIDAAVDAVKEHVAWEVNGHFQHVKRALLAPAGEQRREWDSGLDGDLDGVDQALVVVEVGHGVIVGVQLQKA